MYKIDTIEFLSKDAEGKTTNHLVFNSVHSLKSHLDDNMFKDGGYVQVEITHEDGEQFSFELKELNDFVYIEEMYKLVDEARKYARQFKVDVKYPSDFKAWMLEQFEHNQLADMCNHGVSGGFSGLIYTKEINDLYDRYHVSLWDMLDEMRDNMGLNSDLELMTHFRDHERVDTDSNFKELVVWACAEEIAFRETDGEYKNEDEEGADDE